MRQLKLAGAALSAALTGERWLGVAVDRIVVVNAEDIELERPWTDTESATWNGKERRLTVRWVDGSSPLVLDMAETSGFDAVTAVRERITASQVHVEILKTAAGDVRAFVRRHPSGELFSQLVARGPLTDEEQAQADQLEMRARAAVGMPE